MLHVSFILAMYHDLTFTLQTISFTTYATESWTMTCKMDLLAFLYLFASNLCSKKNIRNRAYMIIYTDSAANWFLWHRTSSPLRQNIIASFIQTDSQARKYSTTDRCQPINFKMFQNVHFLLVSGQTINYGLLPLNSAV